MKTISVPMGFVYDAYRGIKNKRVLLFFVSIIERYDIVK